MREFVFVAAFAAVFAVFGVENASSSACPKAGPATVAASSAATPGQKGARLTPEQRREALEKRQKERAARETAAAKKAGLTLEQYRAERKAKRDAVMAKRLGMSAEAYAKLSIDERRVKFAEMMRKAREAKQVGGQAK